MINTRVPADETDMNPEFASIDNGLWQWHQWFIATANGTFWLLTPMPREFGPFESFDQALAKVQELWC